MQKNITVIGAGLCGSLMAIRLAQRGHRVSLFEKRPDMRRAELAAGRSINLALSDRGLKALRLCGLEEQARKLCIPMHGRMIHNMDSSTRFSRYSGREQDYINSISRPGLNMLLLNAAEQLDDLSLHFQAPCEKVDFEEGIAQFRDSMSGQMIEVSSDCIIGADGAGSVVRRTYTRDSARMRFDFSQSWLTHGYKELSIPAAKDGSYRIEKNALHIWPRNQFMLIALPNLDGSFTVTLFLAFEGEDSFAALDSDENIRIFFEKYFPDAVAHMPDLIEDYHDNPTSPLGTIKCYPWVARDRSLLVGDAAHAIVPFYGQGMNAAFEDVTVLNSCLDAHTDWTRALGAFQEQRKPDADAIADLAVDNFYEMRDHVDNADFIKKRQLEMQLEQQFPDYLSKYSLVTFNEDMRYSEAMRRGRLQDAYLLGKASEQVDWKDMDYRKLVDELLALG